MRSKSSPSYKKCYCESSVRMKPREKDHIYGIANEAFITHDCLFDSVETRFQVFWFEGQRHFFFLGFLERIDRTAQIDSFPQNESTLEEFPAMLVVETVDMGRGRISDLSIFRCHYIHRLTAMISRRSSFRNSSHPQMMARARLSTNWGPPLLRLTSM